MFQRVDLTGFIRTLYTNIFQRVPKANQGCDEVLRECNAVASLLHDRDEALSERQHYEEKVATLHLTGG